MQAVETKNFNEQQKLENERAKFKVKCEHCGHVIVMTFAERTICNHCNKWVYKNDKIKFKYEMKKRIKAN